jgi:hypothetical protein
METALVALAVLVVLGLGIILGLQMRKSAPLTKFDAKLSQIEVAPETKALPPV